jgi:hypothetical protein
VIVAAIERADRTLISTVAVGKGSDFSETDIVSAAATSGR